MTISLNDKAFDEGYNAFDNELDMTDNPYDVEDDNHLSWNDGYMQAELEFDGEENWDADEDE